MNAKLQTSRIISTTLHQIDIQNNTTREIQVAGSHSDLEIYLTELLAEIKNKENKRSFEFLRETTEFYSSLLDFQKTNDFSKSKYVASIVKRLLDKEVETDKRYSHLSKTDTGHVKKGSFLQFLYRENNLLHYLGVKIEHHQFLDEEDFKKKIGLSIANKIYKACSVSFTNEGLPTEVFVYDTNTKLSNYWWNDFLELKEKHTDAYNTKTAITNVISKLNSLKKEFPSDHNILRNACIAAFRQTKSIDYIDFIDKTFGEYEPEVQSMKERLPTLMQSLKELPVKKGFDTKFSLVPSEIPFRKSRYELTKEITLSVVDGIEDLDSKVWAENRNGKKLVIIESPSGFVNFTLKDPS